MFFDHCLDFGFKPAQGGAIKVIDVTEPIGRSDQGFDFAGLGIEFTAKLSQLFGLTHDVLPLVQAVRLPLRAPTVTK